MRLRAVIAAATAGTLLFIAGCGSGGSEASTTSTTPTGTAGGSQGADNAAGSSAAPPTIASGSVPTEQSSAAPSSDPGTTFGPEVPPATAVAKAVPAADLPTASGKFGEKPTLTFPEGKNPPPSLQRQILSEGDGPAVKSGDVLVTNYLGQIWGGKVFDNSYDRKAGAAFPIGVGGVVSGWDVGLVGVKVGSRVMLSLPPADGYKAKGNPQAGIKGTDTLVFVIDIKEALPPATGGQADAKPVAAQANTPTVKGELGKAPTGVTIPKGVPEPTASQAYVIANGTGPKVADNDQLLVQYAAFDWAGKPQGATWPSDSPQMMGQGATGPSQVQVSAQSPFAKLAGVPVGSRVIITIPASQGDGQTQQPSPALAVVVDIVRKLN
ncbi:FKBP-type peptidyl-prolyl cis-trans isomerase [Nakamurella aerolata]|uniref:peptidylprolyl isomerase n=1 Tax=Nakamurella aerolata TaxID=1656892 RepID=A0A849AFP3_9ACTN|nr:FKBP-type peptidyl-prolyl cis-trans isomerase [Nakamurella aerolata]NNG37290.1 FKBP-type peptidyl-prolyl cis-trans isomerase [Nakamurella aerolata]